MAILTTKRLIKRLRASKTQDEERKIIADECANIRSELQDPDNKLYAARIAIKLIFISMMGYPIQWSYMEIVKMCAAAKTHKEKRVAYLALSLLLHSNNEFLMMATATMRNDIESGNQYHASLALAAAGCVGNEEMLRDLVPVIVNTLDPNNPPYLKKKALLVAMRTVMKDPDSAESFIEPCYASFEDKSHATVLAASQLAFTLCETIPSIAKPKFVGRVSLVCKLLNALYNAPKTGDHVIGGIADPFLQCALVRLLSVLADSVPPEKYKLVEETLGRLAEGKGTKRTDKIGPKVAVQFEAARTIIYINASQELKEKATNGLTEALSVNDNTLKYASLSLLSELARYTNDKTNLQRHRRTILACLRQPSHTLKRRALTLLVLLADYPSAKSLVAELLEYIDSVTGSPIIDKDGTGVNQQKIIQQSVDPELLNELISSVGFVCETYSAGDKWRMRTLARLLAKAGTTIATGTGATGRTVSEAEASSSTNSTVLALLSSCCGLIQRTPSLHQYAAQQTYKTIMGTEGSGDDDADDYSCFGNLTPPIIMLCLFVLGEFCDTLFNTAIGGAQFDPTTLINRITQIISLASTTAPGAASEIQRYGLTCNAKIAAKWCSICRGAPAQVTPVMQAALSCLAIYTQAADTDVQQRAMELGTLLSLAERNPNEVKSVLDRIQPPKETKMEVKSARKMRKPNVAIDDVPADADAASIEGPSSNMANQQPQQQMPGQPQLLLQPEAQMAGPSVAAPAPQPQANLLDMIIGGSSPASSSATPQMAPVASGSSDLLSLISGGAPMGSSSNTPASSGASLLGLQGNGMTMGMDMNMNSNSSPFGRQDFKNGFVGLFHKARPVEGGIECLFTLVPNGNIQVQLEYNIMPTYRLLTKPVAMSGANTTQMIRILGNAPYPLRVRVGWNAGQGMSYNVVTIDNAML